MFESNGKSVKVQKILLYGVKYHNNYITYRKGICGGEKSV